MKQSQPNSSQQKYAKGLTLIELMISIAIMSILITAVGPMVRDILIQNRLIGQINELSAVVQLARHSAINEQVTSIVCPSSDFTTCTADWNLPKMVFLDLDADGIRDDNEDILGGTSRSVSNYNLSGPAGVISFQGSGATASPASLRLCHDSNEAGFARALTISLQGRVRVSQDSNNDGIYETNAGADLTCP
ncbi:GspH/FimT family pseudopilin [Alteromonas sp. a30]|uniref:GspH/FimT family pseudopilin n=1 Tax=Alteromonas sp. a30 TaxID=2730917 RepID=UPI00227F0691|nr:GspH/FimT family pseudopilin [Alteromonas sp. a30]MCY7295931.1 prepilin-type N-terminal cleavage/methylation domain-containing protein [Alteromonas sp. a30]